MPGRSTETTPGMTPAAHQRLIPLVLLLASVLALMVPMRFQRWAGWFGDTVQLIAAPVSRPLAQVSRWLAAGYKPPQDEDRIRALEDDNDRLQASLLREIQANEQLRQVLSELRVIATLDSARNFGTVYAPVYATASDLAQGVIRVQAGEREGLTPNSVATAGGLQIVGKVTSVSARTCTVLPITARAAGNLQGMVMLSERPDGLKCQLEPTGEGTLRGPVEDRRDPTTLQGIDPQPGMTVRLFDPGRWPAPTQMMLIGKIETVEPNPDQPLRKLITVRPTIDHLERVSEVVLLVLPSSSEEEKP